MKKLIGLVLLNFLFLNSLLAQEVRVEGHVHDQSGVTLPGVNITVTGSEKGTVSNIEGYYSIIVPSDTSSLIFSFIGMQTIVENVNGRSKVNVIMKDASQELESVIVVAYGTSTKEAFTGAAEVLDEKLIENRPVTSFEKALQGTTAGLMVTSGSGQPGASATVRVRGVGSLSANSAPLYVLDGIPMAGSISDLNPNDIEGITVLKDAAAASLYGSRAANGVILITTKQGKSGNTRISVNSQLGVSQRISDGYALMNSTQIYEHTWLGLYNQALLNGKSTDEAKNLAHKNVESIVGFNPFGVDAPLDNNGKLIPGTLVNTDTDWRDLVYNTGIIQNHNLNIMGGSDVTKVFFSLGYYDDSGTTLNSNFQRYTSKVNVTHKINNFLTAGINTHLSYSKTNAPPSGTEGANPVRAAEIINAASPVYNADGSYNWDNKAVFDFNPIGLAEMDKYRYETKRGIVNSYLNVAITPSLSFRTSAGIDNSNDKGLNYYNPEHGNGAGVNGRTTMSQSENLAWNISNILSYNIENDYSNLELLVGQEAIGEDYSLISAGVTGFSVPGYEDMVWGSKPESPASLTSSWNMISYLGQAKYDYQNRYFLSVSIRRDGSSRFGQNNKYGLFYSAGGGWRVTEESWMPQMSWLNNLKFRGSYGTSGNNSIGNYASLGLYGSGANYGGYSGITPVQLSNDDLSWEKISSFNIGMESRILNRIDLTVEYYQRKSDGLLFSRPLSAAKGFGSILTNLGAMVNTGYEATLSYEMIRRKNLSSTIGLNVSTNANKILSLSTDQIVSGTKLLEEGSSIYQFYMREWAGVNPDNGQPMWYVNADSDDKEGDNSQGSAFMDPLGSGREVTSEYNDAERIRLGTSLPDFFGGVNYNLTYKGLELSCYFYFSYGGKIYNLDYASNMHDGTQPGYNLAADAINAWTPNNKYTDVPRYVVNGTDRGNEMSSRFLEDASYVRLKNITLAYNLSETQSEKLHLKGLRVFVSGENLWTLTNFKGFDPEGVINGTTNNTVPGVKVITGGLKLDL
ncbi:TonB-dependent receptor [Limibacter armeniacum]|uniref:SusC/RagA family TonB-linked outer membrane protein n=1 Tax=Limibacter armeniacum TaxID=466084 RepID=UPI002FE6B4BC